MFEKASYCGYAFTSILKSPLFVRLSYYSRGWFHKFVSCNLSVFIIHYIIISSILYHPLLLFLRQILIIFAIILTLFFFFFFSKVLIKFCFFLLQKDFDIFHVVLCFFDNISLTFLYIYI